MWWVLTIVSGYYIAYSIVKVDSLLKKETDWTQVWTLKKKASTVCSMSSYSASVLVGIVGESVLFQ